MDGLSNVTGLVKDTYNEYNYYFVNSILTAVVLLVALAWNDVVQSAVEKYYPKRDKKTIKGKIHYAVIITIVVILLQIYVFPYIDSPDEISKVSLQ